MAGIRIEPLTTERWADFAQLFGPRGACAGCWCMWWRRPAKEWRAARGAGNRRAHRELVKRQGPTGLLAYVDGQPAGWCAVAPRAAYPRLAASRVLKPVDDQPVWSVTCFYVAREHRGRGLTVKLLRAAAKFARARGAKCLEGYPSDPGRRQADVFVFTGLVSAFRQVGFREVARRSPTRPLVRLDL